MVNQLLLIVGAGASKEFAFPIGDELRIEIADLLNFRKDYVNSRLNSGDHIILEAMQQKVREAQFDSNALNVAYRHISDAMPQAISIDNFLDTNSGNAEIEFVGKLAIVRAILKAEARSTLYLNQSKSEKLEYQKLESTWLQKFFRVIHQQCTVERLPDRLRRIKIVVFNYDRCVEHFLFQALKNYYRVNDTDAARLIGEIQIYHPYGRVGALPWENQPNSIDFGFEPTAKQLTELAAGIKTFTEGTDEDSSEIMAIRQCVREITDILVLGFAYNPLNLELLGSKDVIQSRKRIFGTAYQMSPHDVKIIKSELMKATSANDFSMHEIRADLKCHQIFHEYSRSISFV